MLLRLNIQNLILVQNCSLQFSPKFNVLTGETGSGKSVILSAIGLLMGDRAGIELVRHGEERAIVEGVFSSQKISVHCDGEMKTTLADYSLEDIFDAEEFTIRREITAQGKSKVFLNETLIPLNLLKKISEKTIEFSLQHAHMAVKEDSFALSIVDNMAPEIGALVEAYNTSHHEHKQLVKRLDQIELDLEGRDAEMEKIQSQTNAIEQSQILETDVEAVFQEYSDLESKKALFHFYATASDMLEGYSGTEAPLNTLRSLQHFLQQQSGDTVDEDLKRLQLHITSAMADLTEASFLLRRCLSAHEYNERLLQEYNTRLSKIEKIEKQWGQDRDQIQEGLHKLKKRYDLLAILDAEKEAIELQKNEVETALSSLEEELHETRISTAQSVQSLIQHELHELNMESCQFEIEIERRARSHNGISKATLYITPNRGEKRIMLSQRASGGEMARIFLAIQTVSSSKEKIPTIIFDEVDANIGGITAASVGRKLVEIGNNRQVIAITHFPQVAEQAECHITIRKVEESGRTYTIIEALKTIEERLAEKQRMLGEKREIVDLK